MVKSNGDVLMTGDKAGDMIHFSKYLCKYLPITHVKQLKGIIRSHIKGIVIISE